MTSFTIFGHPLLSGNDRPAREMMTVHLAPHAQSYGHRRIIQLRLSNNPCKRQSGRAFLSQRRRASTGFAKECLQHTLGWICAHAAQYRLHSPYRYKRRLERTSTEAWRRIDDVSGMICIDESTYWALLSSSTSTPGAILIAETLQKIPKDC